MPDEVVKPYAVAVFFCENILLEQDNVLSAIRIVDRIFVDPESLKPDDKNNAPHVQLSFLLKFMSVNYSGKHILSVTVLNPAGKQTNLIEPVPVVFDAERAGVQVRVQVNIVVTQTGRFWVKAELGEGISVRTPLEIRLRGEES